MRCGEQFSLRWQDVDLKRRIIGAQANGDYATYSHLGEAHLRDAVEKLAENPTSTGYSAMLQLGMPTSA
jgi:hypothetical protein